MEGRHSREKKRRARISRSCTFCRSRKIKCDKEKPSCSSCKKNKTEYLCQYDDEVWTKDVEPNKEINERLRQKVNILQARIDALESTVDVQSKKLQMYDKVYDKGLFNSESKTINDDKELFKFAEDTQYFCLKNVHLQFCGPTFYLFIVSNDPYGKLVFKDYFNLQHDLYKSKSKTIEIEDDSAFAHLKLLVPNIITPEAPRNPFKIPQLPPTSIVLLLLRRYFKYCYIFAPFIEEKAFMNEIGVFFLDKRPLNKQDVSSRPGTVAILFIMLRFAYLSLPVEQYSNKTLADNEAGLINEIMRLSVDNTMSYIEFASQIIFHPSYFNSVNIRKVQALLLMKVYEVHCPEDPGQAMNTEVLIPMAIQMAKSIGLNHSPEEFKIFPLDPGEKHVWRKVWGSLLYYDANHAFDFGNTLSAPEFSTTFEHENLNDQWLPNDELKNMKCIRLRERGTNLIIRAVKYFNNANSQTTVSDVEQLIQDFETLLFVEIPSFDQLVGDMRESDRPQILNEIILRMVLLKKLFVISHLAFLQNPSKEHYFVSSVELGLHILKIGMDFATKSLKVLPEYEVIISQQMWSPIKDVVAIMSGFLCRVLEHKVSVIDTVKRFRIGNPQLLIKWLNIDFTDEQKCVKNLYNKLVSYNGQMMLLTVRFFHCYYACCVFKVLLDYFRITYFEKLDTMILSKETLNNVEKFFEGDVDYTLPFEDFLNRVNYNLDPLKNY